MSYPYLLNNSSRKGETERFSKTITVLSIQLDDYGFPSYLRTRDNVYYFPELRFNNLKKIQLLNLLKPNSSVHITYYVKGDEKRILKLENFMFSVDDFHSSESHSSEEEIIKNICSQYPQSYYATLSILSPAKGLVFTAEIKVTSKEKISQYFKEKTLGTAIVATPISNSTKSPSHYYIILSEEYLTFSIPDVF